MGTQVSHGHKEQTHCYTIFCRTENIYIIICSPVIQYSTNLTNILHGFESLIVNDKLNLNTKPRQVNCTEMGRSI